MGSRVLPVFYALLVVYMAVTDRPRLKASWKGISLFAATALILSLPLGIYVVTHPEERLGQINLPLNAIRQGDWRPLIENSLRALGMFAFIGDPYWRQYVADTPVFEPLGAILFHAGLVLALWRWRRLEYAFVLLWLPLALSPAMLSEGAPNFLRPIAAQVTVYVLPALATVWGIAWVGRRLGTMWAWGLTLLAIALLGFNAWRTYSGYFCLWPNHPDARFAYSTTLLDESRYLDRAAGVRTVVLSGHFPADLDPALVDSYLRRQDLVLRWCDVRQALVYPEGGSTHVMRPDYFSVDPVLLDLLVGADVPAYEQHLADGTFVFGVYPLDRRLLEGRLSVARHNPVGWSDGTIFPAGLPDDWARLNLPVRFADKVALVGYEVLNGEQASPGDVVTILTYWHAVQPGQATAITFLHLLRPDGTVAAGYDGFGVPPNRWLSGDVLVQVHRFALSGDLVAGLYPIELGWYDRNTDVRWDVSTGDGRQVNRLLLQPVRIGD
jgi:hypothetical protein